MFETGVRQFRMAMSMVWGRRIDTDNVARLVQDALATLAEFGEPGADVRQLLDGPLTDPAARADFATRSLRRTAHRLNRQSTFYARRFAAADVDPARVDPAALTAIPVTVKRDLIQRAAEFRCSDAPAHLTTRTTGTTGRPAEIWLSRYELDLWAALGTLSGVLRDDIRPTDIMQLNASSRATAAVHLNVASCRLAGAGCRVLGIVPPEEALDSLAVGTPTLLTTCPSYLAELILTAERLGMSSADFRLRRIDVGGEVLSPTLADAARSTFGVTRINDGFGMTEVMPVTAQTCDHGHLHHDLNMGHVEVLDLGTGAPAAPNALGTVVITPYFPYRDCMPVFRYDTRDVVRRLPTGPLTCEMAGLPATSAVHGKADQLLHLTPANVVTPRQLIEAVEALPARPWPARYQAAATAGRIRLTLPRSAVTGLDQTGARKHFAAHGMDIDLALVPDELGRQLRPVRSDLHETTFFTPRLAALGD